MSKTMTNVLSPADAIVLGDLLTAIQGSQPVEWMDQDGIIKRGTLRALVDGPNLAMLAWGKDVRDAYVWITGSVMEYTVPVRHFMRIIPEGGAVFGDRAK